MARPVRLEATKNSILKAIKSIADRAEKGNPFSRDADILPALMQGLKHITPILTANKEVISENNADDKASSSFDKLLENVLKNATSDPVPDIHPPSKGGQDGPDVEEA